MAVTCPTGFDVAALREQVRDTYDRVARNPAGEFHFPRGADYAAEHLGYDRYQLSQLPELCTERFAGVGNPHLVGPYFPGDVVLDHACGAGMDLLLAAQRIGRTGRVIGVDMTPSMQVCARLAADEAGMAARVEIRNGVFEDLPVKDASVDVVISNGVLNLAPDKRQVFREIHRVLRPGGRLHLADVLLQRELTVDLRSDPDLWAVAFGGALYEPELVEIALGVGFRDCALVNRYECFAGMTGGLLNNCGLQGVTFYARKPTF